MHVEKARKKSLEKLNAVFDWFLVGLNNYADFFRVTGQSTVQHPNQDVTALFAQLLYRKNVQHLNSVILQQIKSK